MDLALERENIEIIKLLLANEKIILNHQCVLYLKLYNITFLNIYKILMHLF